MLAQRVATAAAGVPIILALIWIGGAWYTAIVAAALAAASLEFSHLRRDWLDPVSVLTALVVGGIAFGAHTGRYEWWGWLAAGIVIPLVAVALSPCEGARPLEDLLWTAGGVMYVGFLGSFIILLRDAGDGRSWVYLAVLSTFATDTAAYFTGRAMGRRLLAPGISPKKTWEGFVGGCGAGFATAVALHAAFGLGAYPAKIAALGLLLPLAAAAGDLAESAMKRVAGIKDASDLVPGHGGVLDRLDSVLFTFAVTYLFVRFFV